MVRHYHHQKAVLASRSPVTTNLVLGDHYPSTVGGAPTERAFAADRARGWARAAGHPTVAGLLRRCRAVAPGDDPARGAGRAGPRGGDQARRRPRVRPRSSTPTSHSSTTSRRCGPGRANTCRPARGPRTPGHALARRSHRSPRQRRRHPALRRPRPLPSGRGARPLPDVPDDAQPAALLFRRPRPERRRRSSRRTRAGDALVAGRPGPPADHSRGAAHHHDRRTGGDQEQSRDLIAALGLVEPVGGPLTTTRA